MFDICIYMAFVRKRNIFNYTIFIYLCIHIPAAPLCVILFIYQDFGTKLVNSHKPLYRCIECIVMKIIQQRMLVVDKFHAKVRFFFSCFKKLKSNAIKLCE